MFMRYCIFTSQVSDLRTLIFLRVNELEHMACKDGGIVHFIVQCLMCFKQVILEDNVNQSIFLKCTPFYLSIHEDEIVRSDEMRLKAKLGLVQLMKHATNFLFTLVVMILILKYRLYTSDQRQRKFRFPLSKSTVICSL